MRLQVFLPLVTYPEGNSDKIGAGAATIAAFLGADLHAEAFNVDIPNVSKILAGLLPSLPEMTREAEEASRKWSEHLLGVVRAEAAERAVDLTTSTSRAVLAFLEDAAEEAAAAEARYFDMSLVGWEAGNQTSRATAESVIFGSGRPAVILPEAVAIRPVGHVAIAWDGSRVAARAVADARPFLERASEITVLSVVDEKPLRDKDSAERLAVSLRKHGLAAETTAVVAEDCPIGISLQQHAIERGANLLVMGGFGHSVVRDFVLGGATEDVLNDLLLPALFSH